MDITAQPIELTGEKSSDRLKEITDRLEQGITDLFDSEHYKNYLRVMSRFHSYSFNNTMLIFLQKPDATRLAGFQLWKSFGRHVRKGEKGIKVIAPAPYKKTIVEDGEEKVISVPHFKVVSTYDVSQTDGRPLPEVLRPLTGRVMNFDLLSAALMKTSPVPVSFENITGRAQGYYSLADKRIVVRKGMSEQQTLKTLIHEICHAKLHDFDAKESKKKHPQVDRETMECQAEAVAFVCCERFGLDTSDYSFGYIAGWSSGRELKELRSSLEIIRGTAAEIIDSVSDNMLELRQEQERDQADGPVMAMG